MTPVLLAGFAPAVLPFGLTPGASRALTTRWTLQGRRRGGPGRHAVGRVGGCVLLALGVRTVLTAR